MQHILTTSRIGTLFDLLQLTDIRRSKGAVAGKCHQELKHDKPAPELTLTDAGKQDGGM